MVWMVPVDDGKSHLAICLRIGLYAMAFRALSSGSVLVKRH